MMEATLSIIRWILIVSSFEAAILWKEEEFIVQKGCYRFKDGDEEQTLEGDHSKKIYGETYWSGINHEPNNPIFIGV